MVAPVRRPASRSNARFLVRPLFAALVASGVVAPAQGATITVTHSGDAGNVSTCTLRQAVSSINLGAAVDSCVPTGPFGTNDVVDLTTRSGTITLAGTALPIDVAMAFDGPGATTLTISANHASRVLEINDPAIDVRVTAVTIANGTAQGAGGCITMNQAYEQYQTFGTLLLERAVVTGCIASNGGTGPNGYGVGGGVFHYAVRTESSTISGNTAESAGGGMLVGLLSMQQTLVSGNTVLGNQFDGGSATPVKYLGVIGGGGVLVAGGAYVVDSVIRGNTVRASAVDGIPNPDTEAGGFLSMRLGSGGGMSVIGKYAEEGGGGNMMAAGKSTIAGARPILFHPHRAKAVQWHASMAKRSPAGAAGAKAARRPAAFEAPAALVLIDSTVSGNQVQPASGAPANPLIAKYSGGGLAFLSEGYYSTIGNSTVSGNRLPAGNNCVLPAGGSGVPQAPFVASCGAGLIGDSAAIVNSTITGNIGTTAVHLKYGSPIPIPSGLASQASALQQNPQLAAIVQRYVDARAKPRLKATQSPVLTSTIVAANTGSYDIGCFVDCTIGGSNDLVRTFQTTVTLPGGTIDAAPSLAPLANNGGVVAGAGGVAGFGPVQTHALYLGSLAIDAGTNAGSFSYDQRGPGFPRTIGGNTDIGAFEGAIPRPVSSPTAVPALGPWMLGALSALLGLMGFARSRRRS